MDPLSITASSLTLADAAAKIYRFLQSIHRADADYAGLCAELHSLTDFSRSIARTLQYCQRHPLALAPIDEDVWKQSRNAMADSQQTIDELSALVKRIGGPERSDSIIGRARVATEIHVHARDIVAFRDKIRMSNLSLQTLLQVINVSLLLRSNTSQTMILRELEQLNQYLEISIRATAGNNPLFKIDKSDIRVVQSLKNLVRAASDFHSSASSDASTIFSGGHLSMDTMEGCRYAESVLQPAGTVSDRRHLETLLWQNRLPSRMDSLKASRTRGLQSISETQQYPEGEGDEEGLGQHSNLDSLVSGGLNKLAQKALWRFDFSQAEKILQQALGRHKPSASDDTHQSRLRTQLAICSFLQGRGTQIEDAVIDIVEYRGTKRPVGHQLLYNLALSYTHHLNFEAARKIFSRLWESLRDPDFSNSLKRNDILRLLVFSYRMSGDRLLAEAIEEEHPKLARLTDD
ncbi:hypothetical protein BJ166DRAFT_229650 [Pestalotiopsis sp. NC0098]|nr:hypothetical protein BJ166DRAFT_229650 [Pestalotiopsis sp. NC0098]